MFTLPALSARDRDSTRFDALLDRYAELSREFGHPVQRSAPSERAQIRAGHTDAQIARLVGHLGAIVATLEESRAMGEDASQSARLLWRFLARERMTPPGDFFDKIEDGDTLQIYAADHSLQFVSLNFFDQVSFTLDQVFGETWQRATVRDPAIVAQFIEEIAYTFSGATLQTREPAIPWHRVEEVGTTGLLVFNLKVKTLAPLTRNGRTPAFVCTVGCQTISG